jgi:hypothetical protein
MRKVKDDRNRMLEAKETPSRTRDIEGVDDVSWCSEMEAVLATAPIDDEPLTDDDRAALEAGWDDYRHGRTVTLQELLDRQRDENGAASSEVA